jgi:hypothetical protein
MRKIALVGSPPKSLETAAEMKETGAAFIAGLFLPFLFLGRLTSLFLPDK